MEFIGPNHDLYTVATVGPNDCRVQLVDIDGGLIGDHGESAVGWILVSSEDLGSLVPRHHDKPVILATFDIHCSTALAARD